MNQEIFNRLTSDFGDSLGKVLTEFGGTEWSVVAKPESEVESDSAKSLNYKFTLQGSFTGSLYLQLTEASATRLAEVMLGEGETSGAELSQEQREAVLEVMRSLARKLGDSPDGRVQAEVETVTTIAEPSIASRSFVISESGGKQAAYRLHALENGFPEGVTLETAPAEPSSKINEAAIQALGINESQLNLVLDVELNVNLRFGQRQLTLREILDLGSGSVIELDRQVEEPVELLLDGRVIAKGEAVIVDGNYGLRITEIADPAGTRFVHQAR